MKISEIKVGDKLTVSSILARHHGQSHYGNGTKGAQVTVTAIEPCQNAEGGFLFFTDPVIGSGHGISGHWFIEVER